MTPMFLPVKNLLLGVFVRFFLCVGHPLRTVTDLLESLSVLSCLLFREHLHKSCWFRSCFLRQYVWDIFFTWTTENLLAANFSEAQWIHREENGAVLFPLVIRNLFSVKNQSTGLGHWKNALCHFCSNNPSARSRRLEAGESVSPGFLPDVVRRRHVRADSKPTSFQPRGERKFAGQEPVCPSLSRYQNNIRWGTWKPQLSRILFFSGVLGWKSRTDNWWRIQLGQVSELFSVLLRNIWWFKVKQLKMNLLQQSRTLVKNCGHGSTEMLTWRSDSFGTLQLFVPIADSEKTFFVFAQSWNSWRSASPANLGVSQEWTGVPAVVCGSHHQVTLHQTDAVFHQFLWATPGDPLQLLFGLR